MKAAKLNARKTAEIKREMPTSAGQTGKQEAAAPAAEAGESSEKRKLPWELVFLFVVMGITMVVIALKAFSII